jgi:gluconate:H+ symporter, GntP family
MHFLALLNPDAVSYWPFGVLAISVVFIVVAITVLRFHAFLALILAALLAGWLMPKGNLPVQLTEPEWAVLQALAEQQPCDAATLQSRLKEPTWTGPHLDRVLNHLKGKGLIQKKRTNGSVLFSSDVSLFQAQKYLHSNHAVDTLEVAAAEFGKAAGNIGIVIALAALIGMGLMESGAADKIVRRFVQFFGENRGGVALLVSGYFLSVPVFFDTVFFLLVPLARAMAARTGKNFMFYVLAIGGGGALTHSIVPPTPGPLLVADALRLDLGQVIVVGLLAGVLPAVGIYYVAKWLDGKVPVPLREVAGASLADIHKIINKKESELPPFWLSILPVILPVLFIALASFMGVARQNLPGLVNVLGGPAGFAHVQAVVDFLGNKTFALLLGALIALGMYWHQAGLTLSKLGETLGPPLETAGVIILITSAGGAFGAMIRYAGVGDAIERFSEGGAINYLILAWLITAVVRVAQGSATVSMITGSALMYAIIEGKTLPYHPVYIYLAIGFGSMILSWMNDSGFWVVGKLSGFTEKETLKTWTVMVSALSLMGLVEILIFSRILPLT